MLLASSLSGIAQTLAMLSLVVVGGPIMINIVGTMKDVLLTYIGFAVFQDMELTNMVLGGLAISFAGSSHALRTKIKLVG